MTSNEKIPAPVIGVLGQVFSDYYTHAQIDGVFAYADAPGEPPEGNKVQKTMDWLRAVNKETEHPLKTLGVLLEDFLEQDSDDPRIVSWWNQSELPKFENDQKRIHSVLQKAGLSYSTGGHVSKASATPTTSLRELIEQGGLTAVELEMNRAMKQVDGDPNAAAHYAGNVLEAALKAYLVEKDVPFNDQNDTLNKLWQLTRDDLGINPKNLEAKDLKKIASGLSSIVEGTMYLRNKKSGAHGRTETQITEIALRPRHARLVIHSAHTLATYVLECLHDTH